MKRLSTSFMVENPSKRIVKIAEDANTFLATKVTESLNIRANPSVKALLTRIPRRDSAENTVAFVLQGSADD